MKVIGNFVPDQKDIDPKDEQRYLESDRYKYKGGGIVLLSQHEMGALDMLQKACNGLENQYPHFEWGKPDNVMIDDLFMLVYRFAEARFAINDFKDTIERLESILKGKKDDN